MPENKSQYLVSIGNEKPLSWNAATLEANSEKLAKDYPDAKVYQIDDYDGVEEPSNDFSYIVTIGSDTLQWNGATLSANKEKLAKDYPDAKIQKVSAWTNPYIKSESQIAKENLDAFRAENGAYMDDFEVREKTERKLATASALTGVAVPTLEAAITGEERAKYLDLYEQEEALKSAYYNSPEVLEARMNRGENISTMQKDIEKALFNLENDSPDAFKEMRRAQTIRSNPRTALSGTLSMDAKDVQEDYANYKTAQLMLDEATKINNAPSRYDNSNGFVNFLKGMGDTFSDVDFWSRGLSTIAENMNLRGVLSKVQEKLGSLDDLSEEKVDAILTDSEKKVLAAFIAKTDAQYSRAEDMSRALQAGQSAAESFGFMAEFILTGGISKGAAEIAESAAHKVLGNYISKLAGKLAKSTAGRVVNAAGKYAGKLGLDLVTAATRTLAMPSSYKNISEQSVQMHKNPETGKLELYSVGEAAARGFADSFIEALSEGGRIGAMGDFFGDVLKAFKPTQALVKKFKSTGIAELYRIMNNADVMKTLKAGGWHGIGEEYLEEWYGAALRTITNLEPDALKDFATVDQQLITLTSFIPMTLIGGSISTGQYMHSKKDLAKKAEILKAAMVDRGYKEDQANLLVDSLTSSPMQAISEVMSPMINQMAVQENGNAPELFKAVSNFAFASARHQAYGAAYEEQEKKQREALHQQIMQENGNKVYWQTDEEGNETVEIATLEDGTPIFVLSRTESGEAQTTEGEIVPVEPDVMGIDQAGNVRYASGIKGERMSLDDYLNARLIERKGAEEERRIAEQTEQHINDIKSRIVLNKTILNMGTQENPINGLVVGMNADGVMVQTQEGFKRLKWNEVGNKLSLANPAKTDNQIAEEESAILDAEESAREAMLDEQFGNTFTAEVEVEEAKNSEQEAGAAAYNYPVKADGSVDGNALWNENPREWVKWNNQRIAEKYGVPDNGADSITYVQNQLSSLEKSAQAISNQKNKETDFEKRVKLEDDEIAVNKRLAELRSLLAEIGGAQTVETSSESQEQNTLPEDVPSTQEEPKPRERSVESEVARLFDLGLNADEVVENLTAKVAKIKKDIESESKKTPKMGADENAYIAKKKEHQERLQNLQQELDFISNALAAVNETLGNTQVPVAPGVVSMEMNNEPQNAIELAAHELSLKNGGIKLLRDSFLKETGYGPAEAAKMMGLFRTKKNGGMTLAEAGERLMEIDSEYSLGLLDQNDPMAGVNAILEALSRNSTFGELRTYIARNRQEEAQREADAAYYAMMSDYEAAYGMDAEDMAVYNDVRNVALMQNGLSETEYNEFQSAVELP